MDLEDTARQVSDSNLWVNLSIPSFTLNIYVREILTWRVTSFLYFSLCYPSFPFLVPLALPSSPFLVT